MPDPTPTPRPAPEAPRLPRTWRPLGARLAGTIFGGALLVLVIAVWIAFGAEERGRFTGFQKGTLVFLGLLAYTAWFALVRSRVTASETTLTVVNGYRKRVYEWSQVVGVHLRRGAPWAGLDLSDGTTVSVLAIQGSDGQRARDAVRALRRLVASQTRTARDT